jgi:hypothetical protein
MFQKAMVSVFRSCICYRHKRRNAGSPRRDPRPQSRDHGRPSSTTCKGTYRRRPFRWHIPICKDNVRPRERVSGHPVIRCRQSIIVGSAAITPAALAVVHSPAAIRACGRALSCLGTAGVIIIPCRVLPAMRALFHACRFHLVLLSGKFPDSLSLATRVARWMAALLFVIVGPVCVVGIFTLLVKYCQ